MQDPYKTQPEIGDLVRIDWPRTRWDGREGILLENAGEQESALCGCVLIDQTAVFFKKTHIQKAQR
jgi:hypothetical protein